jgi:hypothetical protein
MQHQLTESFTLEAFEWTPECESAYHHTPKATAVEHGGEARYIVLGPCRHTTGYRCEPSALSAMGAAVLECSQCRAFWSISCFQFHRLGS